MYSSVLGYDKHTMTISINSILLRTRAGQVPRPPGRPQVTVGPACGPYRPHHGAQRRAFHLAPLLSRGEARRCPLSVLCPGERPDAVLLSVLCPLSYCLSPVHCPTVCPLSRCEARRCPLSYCLSSVHCPTVCPLSYCLSSVLLSVLCPGERPDAVLCPTVCPLYSVICYLLSR